VSSLFRVGRLLAIQAVAEQDVHHPQHEPDQQQQPGAYEDISRLLAQYCKARYGTKYGDYGGDRKVPVVYPVPAKNEYGDVNYRED